MEMGIKVRGINLELKKDYFKNQTSSSKRIKS
jgi:hypothetical protein